MNACRRWLLFTALSVTPAAGLAQVQQGAGMLTLTTSNTAAAADLRASIESFFVWDWKGGHERASNALAMDSSFALARSWRAFYLGDPATAAETQRAATQAASASVGEAVLALAHREFAAGRAPNGRQLLQTATELMPNDRSVAMWRAWNLTDTARLNALRDISSKNADYVGSRTFLALFLAPRGIDVTPLAKANGDEALRVANDAVRIAPQSSAAHTAVGHVLNALRRDAEALPHLVAATSMTPKAWYAYDILADIHARDGRIAEMRAALDSGIALAPGLANKAFGRRVKAASHLGDGDAARCMAELNALVKDLEAIDARDQLAATHMWMAILAAGARDSAGAEAHFAAAKRYDPAPGVVADNGIIVFSLNGNAPAARAALNDYLRIQSGLQNLTPDGERVRTENIHRQTGLVLLAEKKPLEALAELRQGGVNPYAKLGIIEAHKMMKNNRQANAERAAFFASRLFTSGSSATPVIRYRAKR